MTANLSPEAQHLIELLELAPHPEGGYFRETFRDTNKIPNTSSASKNAAGRAQSTAIYFLLTFGQRSHWHRVDAVEIWHWHKGAPLRLSISDGTKSGTRSDVLGCTIEKGERPQLVVPQGAWQSAQTLGDFTLVGCTVAPGFEFEGFEMAPAGWTPA